MFLYSVSHSSKFYPRRSSWGHLIYSQLARSPRDNLGLQLVPEVGWGGSLMGLNPQPGESDAVSG